MAKIPFSIEHREKIESGEYKVVTGDDRPVRIISWDKMTYGGRYDIVALVPTSQGDTDTVQLYCPDGTLLSSNMNEKFKLFILTPEPELTEFEADVMVILLEFVEEVDANDLKRISKDLLDLATEELKKTFVLLHKDDYQTAFDLGKAEALKDLPRWNKHDKLFSEPEYRLDFKITSFSEPYLEIKKGNDYYYIRCSELKKLPGFNED